VFLHQFFAPLFGDRAKRPMALNRTFWLLFFVLACGLSPGRAQADLSQLLLEETLRMPQAKSALHAVWLVPVAFWEQTWPEGPSEEDQELRRTTLSLLADYALLAVVAAGSASVSVDQLKLTVKGNGVLPPASYLVLSEELQLFLDRVRPMVANVFQVTPEKVMLMMFSLPDAHKRNDAAVYDVVVRFQDEIFEWTLPPAALQRPGTCPADGKVMTPGWKYCPWHGNALTF